MKSKIEPWTRKQHADAAAILADAREELLQPSGTGLCAALQAATGVDVGWNWHWRLAAWYDVLLQELWNTAPRFEGYHSQLYWWHLDDARRLACLDYVILFHRERARKPARSVQKKAACSSAKSAANKAGRGSRRSAS